MPVRRIPRARREQLSVDEAVSILVGGHDFFGVLDGGAAANMEPLRRAWDDPEIRAAVYRRRADTHRDDTPWAAERFAEADE